MTLRRALIAVATATTLVAAWLWVIPGSFGGGATWAIVDGSSMEPRLHRGDLVVLRPSGHYEPGMLVGYRSTMLNRIVLHRIVRVEGSRYVFKGDNNDYLDPERPTRSELLGSIRIRVPAAGPALVAARSPLAIGLLLGLVTLLLALPGRAGGDRPASEARPESG